MAYVIGIDIGGTFTDACVADEEGPVAGTKTPSTPPDFAEGFPAVPDELAGPLETSTGQLLSIRKESSHFTDRVIVFRRSFRPPCLPLLQSEVVPADEPPGRRRSLKPELEGQS